MIKKRVLFVIAHQGYQSIEYTVPKKILEEAGYTVITASNKSGIATASDKTETMVDITLSNVIPNEYDGIFFIGGPGAIDDLDNTTSYTIIQETWKEHKIIGAICIATRLLANAGILEGKQATGWDGDNELSTIYKDHLVNYIREDVVVDFPIITATGPSAAQQFGQNALILLQGQSSWG